MGFFPRTQRSFAASRDPRYAYGRHAQGRSRGFDWRYPVIGLGIPLGGAGIQALLPAAGGASAGAGAGASAGAGAGYSSPGIYSGVSFGVPTAGGAGTAATVAPQVARMAPSTASRLGSVFNSSGMNLGVNAGLSIFGMRSQNRANEQARLDALRMQQQSIDLQLRQIEEMRRNSELDREEARRLNDRSHALELQRYELDREARAFERQIHEQREALLAPYRQISTQAMNRLSALWGL